jgi:D-sedoheptulose 7-phosphate isomerase
MLTIASKENYEQWRDLLKSEEYLRNAMDIAGLFSQFKDKKIYFFGNGASAAIASHLANDIFKALRIRTGVMHDPSVLTCFSNDFGYEHIFSQYLEHDRSKNDLVVLISSSGRSPNIIQGLQYAKESGSKIISLTGNNPDQAVIKNSDILVKVDSKFYNIIECIHMSILCCAVDILNPVSMKS